MDNKWNEIWNKKETHFDELDIDDYKSILIEMKRLAGWDHFGKGSSVCYEDFAKEHEYMKENLCLRGGDSVFELGCGAGANLYLFAREGVKVGGMDYAVQLIEEAKRFIPADLLLECVAGEAVNLSVDMKFDAVMAPGVFKYFPSDAYAEGVLDKMLVKAKRSLGILRTTDEAKREEFLAWKRSQIEDYDEKYKDLPERCFAKSFFSNWAEKNHLEIKFAHHHIDGAWNDPFTYDCFMYKK